LQNYGPKMAPRDTAPVMQVLQDHGV